jgi:iron-sulfur cluster assembly protein
MGIGVTDSAVQQIKVMKAKHGFGDNYGLRVGVKSGGCAGFEYIMELEEGPLERDRVYEFDGVNVFVDRKSYLFVNGIVLHFAENLLGGNWVFQNPNATSSCGCGTSFST